MKKDYWLYGLAVVTGILVWVVVSEASGRERRGTPSGISTLVFRWSALYLPRLVMLSRASRGDGGRSSYWPIFLDAVHPRAG